MQITEIRVGTLLHLLFQYYFDYLKSLAVAYKFEGKWFSFTEIKRAIRKYHEQLHINKLGNLYEIG